MAGAEGSSQGAPGQGQDVIGVKGQAGGGSQGQGESMSKDFTGSWVGVAPVRSEITGLDLPLPRIRDT